MNISTFAVQRPIMTVMAALIVILIGLVSLWRLAIDLMPDITYPTLSINTTYSNASPEEMEELITRPVEEAVSAVPGVEQVTSISAEGQSSVRVTFAWGTDLDTAASDLRDRLDRVIPRLPEDADRPMLRKFDLASFPILILGVSSNLDPIRFAPSSTTRSSTALNAYRAWLRWISGAVWSVKSTSTWIPRKSRPWMSPWIRSCSASGPRTSPCRPAPSSRVCWISPSAPRCLYPPGRIAQHGGGHPRRRSGPAPGGRPVEDRWEKVSRIIRVNGKPGVRLAVNKQSGKNTVEVAEGVLSESRTDQPGNPAVEYHPHHRHVRLYQALHLQCGPLHFYGGFLAVFVLLMFLRNIASTAIIVTTIPISVVATFALMYSGGFTLNIMTLGGLALGVGMLVDNAIVVLENIFRLREQGHASIAAAIQGSQEVRAAVIASTITTWRFSAPGVRPGMSGIMFKQLAYVVSFALACSLTVALTLVPMLASRMGVSGRADSQPAAHCVARGVSGWHRGVFYPTGRSLPTPVALDPGPSRRSPSAALLFCWPGALP
jgi:hydrophobic/amphiphilic exporter-1 (mainly G- bacteria), HAE1 family